MREAGLHVPGPAAPDATLRGVREEDGAGLIGTRKLHWHTDGRRRRLLRHRLRLTRRRSAAVAAVFF